MPIECSHDSGTYAHTKKITVHKEKQSKNKNNKMLQEHHKKS
jgi:hypothetical protein